MELKWLEDFLALRDVGNFRAAAEMRCVSQPAFSRRIQALETWTGARLFDRDGQPTRLTESGIAFAPVVQNIVDIAYASRQEIQSRVQEDKERLCFATVTSLAQIFIPGWLKKLQPFIDANQFVVKTDFDTIEDYFAVLDDNTLDFFVCYEDPHHRFHDNEETFSSLKLGSESLVPVVSPNKDGTPRWWLPDQPAKPIPCLHTLSNRSPSPIWRHMASRYRPHQFKSVYDSTNTPTVKAMAIEGFGLAWIPSAHIIDDLAAGRLVRAAQQDDDIKVDIMIFRSTKQDEPRVDKFWKVLLTQESSQG